jgi:hypothetical protein
MTKKNIKKSNKTIRVEILESTPNSFYIQDLDKIEPKKITTKDIEYKLNIITSTNKKEELIKIELELDAFLIKDETKGNPSIFGIKSSTVFRTPDFKNIINEELEVSAPDNFTKKLLNISIGGIRGMLSVNLTNTELNHITLPLLDLGVLKDQEIVK